MHLQEETEGSKEVQGLHFPHLALAFPVACYRLVTNFQETNRQQETHARSVNLRLSRNLSSLWSSLTSVNIVPSVTRSPSFYALIHL